MYISFTFIAYMAATFIALLGIGIAILLILRKDAVKSELYKAVIGFAVIVFLY